MTTEATADLETAIGVRPSTLPFDPADLVAMRVRPAQFARMVGVSKQAVSVWIREGKVTLGPDGLLDPAVASRQVIERSDPTRLRARVFRQATASVGELRSKVAALEAKLQAVEQATEWRCSDETARRLARFLDALREGFASLVQAHEAGALDAALDRLEWEAFYGFPPGDFPDGDEGPEEPRIAEGEGVGLAIDAPALMAPENEDE